MWVCVSSAASFKGAAISMNHVTGTPTSHAREHNPRTPTQPAAGKKNGNLVENHTGKDIPRITTTDGDCATAPWAALQCPVRPRVVSFLFVAFLLASFLRTACPSRLGHTVAVLPCRVWNDRAECACIFVYVIVKANSVFSRFRTSVPSFWPFFLFLTFFFWKQRWWT